MFADAHLGFIQGSVAPSTASNSRHLTIPRFCPIASEMAHGPNTPFPRDMNSGEHEESPSITGLLASGVSSPVVVPLAAFAFLRMTGAAS